MNRNQKFHHAWLLKVFYLFLAYSVIQLLLSGFSFVTMLFKDAKDFTSVMDPRELIIIMGPTIHNMLLYAGIQGKLAAEIVSVISLVEGICSLVILSLCILMFRNTCASDTPFLQQNLTWLKVAAYLIIGIPVVKVIIQSIFLYFILRSELSNMLMNQLSVLIAPIGMSMLILIVYNTFQQGIVLQLEQDQTL